MTSLSRIPARAAALHPFDPDAVLELEFTLLHRSDPTPQRRCC
jgi:hypothetical protein